MHHSRSEIMKNTLLTLALLAAFNAHTASANLITNGDFEDFTVTSGTFQHISTPDCVGFSDFGFTGSTCSTDGKGWDDATTIPANGEYLEIRNNLFGVAQSGNNYAELNPTAQSSFSQTFTASGGLGLLNWWDRGRGDSNNTSLNYDYSVYLNNAEIFSGQTESASVWTQRTFTRVLLNGNNTLEFRSSVGGGLGANIDNISVAAVPEPETYAMFLIGLGLLGFAARRQA